MTKLQVKAYNLMRSSKVFSKELAQTCSYISRFFNIRGSSISQNKFRLHPLSVVLIVKLHDYGFSSAAVRPMYSYLTNRNQRIKINSSSSSYEEILFGVPQGSMVDPLLFNIFLFDMFFSMNENEFASHVDNNTP